MKRWMPVGMSLFIFLAAGCGESPADSVTATPAQNGQSVALVTGKMLIVELPGNPTTGYEWTVVQNDASLLQPEEPAYEPDSSAIGSGGLYTFKFRALKAATALLRLTYRRSWEPDAIETFSLTVNIQDP